jgi:HEPN domain-containing protein
MLPTTREWVKKAEGDYDVVTLLLRSRKRSRYDPICFHAQQCVEKYLKARLTEAGIAFPKTHDLPALLALCAPVQPLWGVELPRMNALTGWAILARYPGSSATKSDARDAADSCRRFRELARDGLGI